MVEPESDIRQRFSSTSRQLLPKGIERPCSSRRRSAAQMRSVIQCARGWWFRAYSRLGMVRRPNRLGTARSAKSGRGSGLKK